MAAILENAEADLTPQMPNLIDMLWSEWKMVEQQVLELTQQLERISDADAGGTRIRQIPAIGPIVATAIVAAIGKELPSIRGDTSLQGWESCRNSIPPAATRSCSGSASGVTCICARF
jgi:hypothetical protein